MAGDVKIRIKSVNAFEKGVKGAIAAVKRLGRAVAGVGKTMLRMAKWAGIAAVGFGVMAVKAASDVQEMRDKFGVVFGEMADETRKWADKFAAQVGRSKFHIMGFLATVQDMVVPMGLTRKEAAELSKAIVTLASDVASFQNKNEASVVEAMTKALLGERESLKLLGISITEAEVKAKAFQMGLAKNTKEVSLAAKAHATLALMQERSADAQGNAAKTAMQFANRIRYLRGRFHEFRVEVGTQILDGLKLGGVMGDVGDSINRFTQKLAQSKIVQTWAEKAREAFEGIQSIIDAVIGGGDKGATALEGLKTWGANIAKSLVQTVLQAAPFIGHAIGTAAKGAFFGVAKAAGERSAASSVGARAKKDYISRNWPKGAMPSQEMINAANRVRTSATESALRGMQAERLRQAGLSLRNAYGNSGDVTLKDIKLAIEKMDKHLDQNN